MSTKDLIKQLSKEMSESRFAVGEDIQNVETVSTGSMVLDNITWWYVKGWFTEIFWKNWVGKSLLSLMAIKAAQKRWELCAFIDCEHTFNPAQAKKLWVDMDNLVVMKCNSWEDAGNAMFLMVKKWVSLIVVDSVAAATPRKEIETDIAQQTMWLHARLWNRIFRTITWLVSDMWATVLLINQERATMEMYAPINTTGWMWIDYACSQRIQMLKPEREKDNSWIKLRFKVYKNKLWWMWEWDIQVSYEWGIIPKNEVIDVALEMGIIERAWAYYSFGETKAQGKEAMYERDDKVIDKIKKTILDFKK